ncbi:hypothetical protein [Ideonella dechloratans]|uniref:hypothetical protein n=1 Tax=Ideonella dechloratans TaxID=36863 RepID=UPI0035B1B736
MTEEHKPKKSVTRSIEGKAVRTFSSFNDLAEWAVAEKRATSVDVVRNQPTELWGELLFDWFGQGQIACIFAVSLAQKGSRDNWYNILMPATGWDAETVTAVVDAQAEAGADAIQIIFPGTGDADQAVAIMTELVKSSRWLVADVGQLAEEGDCKSHQVGLRWISPDKSYESWVLGIGDFDAQPFTRRFTGAPFVALVIRPSPPVNDRAPAVNGESGLPAAHLAHLDDELGDNDDKRKKWTDGTRTAKRHLIKPEPLSRARARVTFAFSPDMYAKLQAQAKVQPYAPPEASK